MSEPIVYPLIHKIEVKSAKDGAVIETITELTLIRPKGKQLRVMDKAQGEVGKTLALIAACSSHPVSVMDGLDGEDMVILGGMVENFLGGRLPTGGTSSQT